MNVDQKFKQLLESQSDNPFFAADAPETSACTVPEELHFLAMRLEIERNMLKASLLGAVKLLNEMSNEGVPDNYYSDQLKWFRQSLGV